MYAPAQVHIIELSPFHGLKYLRLEVYRPAQVASSQADSISGRQKSPGFHKQHKP
jgi:hypothetical protein